jgi:hypothetical protein
MWVESGWVSGVHLFLDHPTLAPPERALKARSHIPGSSPFGEDAKPFAKASTGRSIGARLGAIQPDLAKFLVSTVAAYCVPIANSGILPLWEECAASAVGPFAGDIFGRVVRF